MNANHTTHAWPQVCLADTRVLKPKHIEYYLDKEGRLRLRLMRAYVTVQQLTLIAPLPTWDTPEFAGTPSRKFSMLTVWAATTHGGDRSAPSTVRTNVALARTFIERFGSGHKVEESIHALRTMRLLVEARLARESVVVESSYGKHQIL